MATSIIINATDADGKAVSKSYTDLKADATDAELRTFANGIVGFTNHTLDSIYRVDKKDITSPRDPNFTVTPSTYSVSTLASDRSITFALSYLGEARTPTVTGKRPSNTTLSVTTDSIIVALPTGAATDGGMDTATMTITLPAIDDYEEATATVTFTSCYNDSLIDN